MELGSYVKEESTSLLVQYVEISYDFCWLFRDLGEGAKPLHMSFKSAIFMSMPSS